MSTINNFVNLDNQCNNLNLNNNNNPSSTITPPETSTAIITETNPTNKMDSSMTNKDDILSRNDKSTPPESWERQDAEIVQSPGCDNDTTGQDSNTDQKNDSSTFSTAFTISFEDDSNTSKKLGIKDSIRKFAPPKPHTIEKPRTKNDQNQDHSLVSVESAPAGLSKHSKRKGCSNSSRSSSRKSNSSRHSNISESAAFLIDKMLNFKQPDLELGSKDKHPGSSSKSQQSKSPSSQSKKTQPKRLAHSSDDILDSEIDFCEDKSDNGTYIVGADPESEAARKKIDELFGVVKAAEASVIAESASRSNKAFNINKTNSRPSRLTDKKPLSRERQEHINRLAYRNSSMSRSSSSSRQDNSSADHHHHHQQQRNSSHHSRNSSCDRTNITHGSRPRRSASQSSRQSSNKELSDGDTRSSRSSLHNDADIASNENSVTNHPDMKFNRAFVLRRARLGLGEPVRVTPPSAPNHNYSQEQEQQSSLNNMSSSQRRHQINSNTYKASHQQQQQGSASSGSANFCRDDGGRFSLRMKNNALPSRLSSAHASNRSSQHSALIDSCLNKVSSVNKNCGITNVLSPIWQQEPALLQQQQHQRTLAKHAIQSPCTSTGLPCPSSDELETISPSRSRLLLKAAGRLPKKGMSDLEGDSVSYNQRFNYSLNNDFEANNYSLIENRASSSVGKPQHQRGSNLQLGALDSLVISAISSLSLKIRHSVCDTLVEHAKKLPVENETRLIVEEILPQLTANPSSSKSPTSIEEIDQSLYFDLAKTLKNLKKVEQMVEVINLISNQIPPSSSTASSNNNSFKATSGHATGSNLRASDSTTNLDMNSVNDLSPV